MDTDDDGLLDELAAARPHQTDPHARALHRSVRRSLLGVDDEPYRLGRFTVLGRLGSGGMGTVFIAYDPDLDRKIALKVLHTRGDRGRKDVLREGRALARLEHPHVVTVFEVGVVDDQVFVAMEYVPGVGLRAWLRDRPAARAVLALLLEAGRGLAAAHDAGLVHLDFKPENLVVDSSGHARVIDFGLARDLAELAPTPASTPADATTSARGGTPAYMAPERLHGARGDHRSDQYSFCVTCWEALVGQRPRSAEDPPPARAGLPPRMAAALRRGMRPDPADRFPTMHALLAELSARPTRRRAAALALAATAGLVLAAYTAGQRSAPERSRCESAWPHVDTTWSPTRAAEVGAAFTAVDVPFARATWATVRTALDDRAEAWTRAHHHTCADAVRGAISPARLDQRLACLEDRRRHLANLVDLLAVADAKIVTTAIPATYRLPEIDACAAPGQHDPLFAGDRARVEEVLAIRDQLAGTRAELELRDPTAAEPRIAAVVARARELDAPALLADALDLAARADDLAGRTDLGVAHARAALRLAVAHEEPTQAATAAVTLTMLLDDLPADTLAARSDLLAVAAASSRRAGRPPQIHATVERARAAHLMKDGHHAEASAILTDAVAFAERHGDRHAAARALADLGTCRDMLGDHRGAAAALRRAIAELEPLVGALHPWTAELRVALATSERLLAPRSFERPQDRPR